MKHLVIFLFILFIANGCAKKASPTPRSAVTVETIPVGIEEQIIEVSILNPEIVEMAVEESSPAEEAIEELPGVVEISEPQTSIGKELDYDQLFPDSIWTEYMTRRGDYLSLIAYNEYNNANEWRRIYQWNREHWEEKGIGPDRDNPNFIYPYRELDLKKPATDAIEWAYDHYIHIVESGETLWTIAKKEYGDELAWVVLFWDNEELLESQDGKLIPGLKLKVRSELWPDVE